MATCNQVLIGNCNGCWQPSFISALVVVRGCKTLASGRIQSPGLRGWACAASGDLQKTSFQLPKEILLPKNEEIKQPKPMALDSVEIQNYKNTIIGMGKGKSSFEYNTLDQNEKPQVFHIANQDYTYNQAKCKCASYNAKLATYSQLVDAHNGGAEWCSYGWSQGQNEIGRAHV